MNKKKKIVLIAGAAILIAIASYLIWSHFDSKAKTNGLAATINVWRPLIK